MNRPLKSAFLSVIAATALAAGLSDASAGCRNGICVSGSDDGRTHIVYIESNDLSGATHYNVVHPGRAQFETTSSQFSYRVRPGRKYSYSIQACKRGGVFQSSMCTRWARFTHTTPE